jgi:uncharacterized protein DUF4124
MNRSLLFIFTMALAAAASAQQYKWVDQDGKVRYGDVPPPGVKAQRLKPPATGSSATDPAAAAKKDAAKPLTPEQAFRKRQEDAAKDRETQAKADQEAQAKRESCARAQDALRSLESGQRISRTDSKGERYFLDEAQTAQETAKARQQVQQLCN